MQHTAEIRGVAFDIDGTLYPNGRMYRASLGIVLRHLRLFRAFGAARREIRSRRPVTDLRRETAELTARRLGIDADTAGSLIESVVYERWERVLRRVPLFPGARDLLVELRERNVPLAAMSDFPVTSKLHLLGLDGLWDVAFSSEELGYLKPNREPFEELAARLALPPEQILYVGNSYHYDVLGAGAVGFRTAHLPGTPAKPGKADVAVRSFAELRGWLLPRLAE